MPGNSDDDGRAGPHTGQPAPVASAPVMDGIRSLHERIDELQRVVVQRLEPEGVRPGSWPHEPAGAQHQPRQPAWRRRTNGEARWQVAAVTAVGIALQIMTPGRLVLLHPVWVLPALQGLLLITLVTVNPHRINRESRALRLLSLTLAALLSLANAWSVERLVAGLVQNTVRGGAGTLLVTSGAIWLTNVVAFALWYWEFDRGGPVARALGSDPYPDFLFVQMTTPNLAPPHWEPAFADYLYLAFTNATAFSPTDVMPMSRWAKMAMTVQALISIVTVVLVVARAVNIL